MKLFKILPLLIALTACLHGENLIKNPNFTEWATSKPSIWNDRSKQSYKQLAGGGLEVEVVQSKGHFGEILQKITVEPGRQYRIAGDIRGSSSRLGFIQVKRYAGGSEIDRVSTDRNQGADWNSVEKTFDSTGVEYVEVLLRWQQKSENIGSIMSFRNITLEIIPATDL